MRILFVVNNPAFFLQQHLPVAEESRRRGHDVHLAAPEWFGADGIREMGFQFHALRMTRGRVNILNELTSILDLAKVYRRLQPDLVHHLTHKPILYGTIAARLARVPAVVNANTGLGYVFIDKSVGARLLRGILQVLFRATLRHRNQFDLFLNPDDREEFIRRHMTRSSCSGVVSGPGVDTSDFPFADLPVSKSPVVVLPARLLTHKGVREFVDAARILRERAIAARFALVGEPDPGNAATIPDATIQQWVKEGIVEYWGYRTDMQSVFAQCSVCVLPSYREGLGRVLLEAASTGRPLVAFDVPGCREVVLDGFNGLLAPAGDTEALATSIGQLVLDESLRVRMGRAGRSLVVERFGIDQIVEQTLAVHDRLLGLSARRTTRKLSLLVQSPAAELSS